MTSRKQIAGSLFLCLLSLVLGLGMLEGVLRLKNRDMRNYDIEMWRYAKELKVASPDPKLGHVHRLSSSAELQSVTIRTNEWGLRGGPVDEAKPPKRRILFLGSSITLGWGVKEAQTMTALIQERLRAQGEDVEVLNAGIGNYNSVRYVELFFKKLKDLNPTDIVVHYFLRDAEVLEQGRGNWFLRNSELAVTLWNIWSRTFRSKADSDLFAHYERVYQPDSPGFRQMKESLGRLAGYAREKNIRLYLAMTPDVHNLQDYKFGYIHERMKEVASSLGYSYIDLLPSMKDLDPKSVWAMPGDPHPNALGHERMAEAIYPVLSLRQPAGHKDAIQ